MTKILPFALVLFFIIYSLIFFQQTLQWRKAIDRYKRFLEIWKNADENLPEKKDALAMLDKLTKYNIGGS
jgi:hypothetical protein